MEMLPLMVDLMRFCKEEIDGLGRGYGYTCSNSMTELATGSGDDDYFLTMMSDSYGVDTKKIESGFSVTDFISDHAFELTVSRMVSEDEAVRGMEGFQSHLKDREAAFTEKGLPEEAELAANGLVVQTGRYLALFICQNPQAAEAELEAALRDLSPAAEPSSGPSVPPGTPEHPIFVELDDPMPEGEPDPNHPGRIKYVQPNKEDMTVYDTSAILTAWEKGDPAGLSEDDRAIYDAAQAVLEEVLHDGMSPFETEATLYDWVLQNIEYGWSHADVLEETPREAYTPYGGLVDRMAVCLGYASSFQLLMEMVGMECITVVGASHASTGDHAWNMVRLDGEWYCVDATWDFAYRETMNGCEWRYFNVTSDYMARTNHQWDYDAIPEATAEGHGIGNKRG